MTESQTPQQPEPSPTPNNATLVLPLRFGERFGWSLRFALRHFWYLLGLQLLFLIVAVVLLFAGLFLVSGTIAPAAMLSGETPAPIPLEQLNDPVTLVIGVCMLVLMSLWSGLYGAALYRLPVRYLELGKAPGYGALLRESWSRLPDALNAITLVLLLFLAIPALAFGTLWMMGQLTPLTIKVSAVLLLMIYFIMALSLMLVGPVVVNEPLSGWQAIKLGWTIAGGRRLSVLGFVIVLPLFLAIVGWAITTGAALGSVAMGNDSIGAQVIAIISALLMIAIQIIATPALAAGLTSYYLESKIFQGGWIPPWKGVLKAGWPRTDAPPSPVDTRGVRGWRDLILLTLFMGVGLWFAKDLLKTQGVSVISQAGVAMGMRHWLPAVPSQPTFAPPVEQAAPDVPPEAPALPREQDERPAAGAIHVTTRPALSLSLGPAFSTGSKGTVWIQPEVRWPGVDWPQKASLRGRLVIRVEAVKDLQGRELYDAEAGTESRFFWNVKLKAEERGRYTGIRQVALRRSVELEQIGTVKGTVYWHQPKQVRVLELTAALQGRRIPDLQVPVTLRKWTGRQVELAAPRTWPEQVVAVVALADGDWITPNSYSRSMGYMTYHFGQPIEALRLYVADQSETLQQAFQLQPDHPVSIQWKGAYAEEMQSPTLTLDSAGASEARPAARTNGVAKGEKTTPQFDLTTAEGHEALRDWLYRAVRQGRCEAALPWLDKLIVRNPDDPWVRLVRGQCRKRTGDTEGARIDLDKACRGGYETACNP